MELTTEATITKAGIKSDNGGYNQTPATVLDLSFSLRLPRPTPVKPIEAWAEEYGTEGGARWKADFERKSRDDANAKAKKTAKKVKKGEPKQHTCDECDTMMADDDETIEAHECPPCPTCGLSGYDGRQDCECKAPPPPVPGDIAAFLQPHYDAYVETARARNRTAMEASTRAAPFISLINTPVRITLSPMQEGMLFALEEGASE